jgi:hypothetical protein
MRCTGHLGYLPLRGSPAPGRQHHPRREWRTGPVDLRRPHSRRGGYHSDFATLDRNHGGFIRREDAKATLDRARGRYARHLHTGRPGKAPRDGRMEPITQVRNAGTVPLSR